MLDPSLVIRKDELTTVTENNTIADVYTLFTDPAHAHKRALPILDQSGQLFRGNIYRQHIFEHVAQNGDTDLPVTTMMRNSTKFVHISSEFYETFFAIRDLPFITVLDDANHFYGIFTHSALMNLLLQSWAVREGGVALAIISHNTQGDLSTISRIITRYTDIVSVQSLREGPSRPVSIMFTLPLTIKDPLLQKITAKIIKKKYTIASIEDLNRFQ